MIDGLLSMNIDDIPSTPSKIKWDLTNGPLGKVLELLDSQV